MREIKFRQRAGDKWHYWGFIDGTFVNPIYSDGVSVEQAQMHSDQYIGVRDRYGVEIYERDIVMGFDDEQAGTISFSEEDGAFLYKSHGRGGAFATEAYMQNFKVIGNHEGLPTLPKPTERWASEIEH